jgi:hypothetical protein
LRARLLVGGFLFLLVAAGLLVRQFWFMTTWPETDAIVTGTRIVEEKSGSNGRPFYRAQVDVRYDLHGQAVQGRAFSTYWSSDRAKAEERLAGFVAGSHKKVRYDPSSPGELRFDVEPGFESLQIPLLSAAVGILLLASRFYLGRNHIARR